MVHLNDSRPGSLRLAAGSLWALIGQILTFGASFVATPFVIAAWGTERYSAFVLIQVVLMYLAVADCGMGLASSRFAAVAHAKSDDEEEAAIIWTAAIIAAIPTAAIASVLLFGGHVLVDLLAIPSALRDDAVLAWGAAGGILVARVIVSIASTASTVRFRFGRYTLIWTSTAVLQSVGLPIVLASWPSLTAGAVWVVTTTALAALLHCVTAMRLMPALALAGPRRALMSPLLQFGLASAGSVLVEAAISSGERLLLARMAPLVAVGYFAIAFTIARLPSALPAAVGIVLQPTFTRLHTRGATVDHRQLYWQGTRVIALVLIPVTAVLMADGRPLLHLWLGAEFARESGPALLVLSLAGVVDGVSYVPRVNLSAIGHPGAILRYHLINLGPYLVIAALLVASLGVLGAAVAWSLRAAVEAVQAFVAVGRVDPGLRLRIPEGWRAYLICVTPLVPAVAIGVLAIDDLGLSLATTLLGLAAYSWLTLRLLVAPEEKLQLLSLARSMLRR